MKKLPHPRVALFVTERVQPKMFPEEVLGGIPTNVDLKRVIVDGAAAEEALAALTDCDAVPTGWQSPTLTDALLAKARRLRFVGSARASASCCRRRLRVVS